MSVGPLGPIISAIAGTPLAQGKNETDANQGVRESQERRVAADRQAEAAAGIGETDGENHETEERDADGRRPWELPPVSGKTDETEDPTKKPADPHGELGRLIDLTG